MHTLTRSFREDILEEAKQLSESVRMRSIGHGYWIGLDEEVEGYLRLTSLEDGRTRMIYLFQEKRRA
jgi:hypothetical protein